MQRSLALLEGGGLRLQLGDDRHALRPCQDAIDFCGEVPASAELDGGPIIDLNLMSRRNAWRQRLWHLHLDGERRLDNDADVLLLLCRVGRLQAHGWSLQAGQAMLLEDERGELRLHGQGACLHVAELRRRP